MEGSASRSYGIHVARLAGVPRSVLDAAQQKLDALESERHGTAELSNVRVKDSSDEQVQLSLFNSADSVVAQKIKNLDLMNLTPSGAIKVLEELKEEVRDI